MAKELWDLTWAIADQFAPTLKSHLLNQHTENNQKHYSPHSPHSNTAQSISSVS